ncbi:Protein cueball [Dirofilaria immitis]|nr:Protein cueball [Dirofilaria immitis]
MIMLQIISFFTITIVANAQNLDSNSTTKSIKIGYSSLWLPRSFRIICCFGGYPIPENPQIIRNWTHEKSDYISDERYDEYIVSSSSSSTAGSRMRDTAKRSYLLSASVIFTFDDFTGIGVTCKCPEMSSHEHLDRSCRRLKPCINNGHRSFSSNSDCICPEPYFGEQCEKYCDQGQRLRGADGRDYCACTPFYQGEECRNVVCLNGGTEIRRQCLCPPNFLGYHCEIDANRTSVMLRFHGYREQPRNDRCSHSFYVSFNETQNAGLPLFWLNLLDLNFAQICEINQKVQNRFATVRREALFRSGIEITSRRGNVIVPEDPGILSFRTITLSNEGPPPYIINPHSRRSYQRDNLPPLPTYEDATKLPPFNRQVPLESQTQEETCIEEEEQIIQNYASPSELQISEEATETDTNNELSVARSLVYSPESRDFLETTTSVSDRGRKTNRSSWFPQKFPLG